MVCQAVKMMLEFDGHHVTMVEHPAKALEIFKPGIFDVVLSDFAMPEMNGDELIQEIRKMAPGQRAAIITAYAEVLPPTHADLVIPKPFMLADLREAMGKLCPGPEAVPPAKPEGV